MHRSPALHLLLFAVLALAALSEHVYARMSKQRRDEANDPLFFTGNVEGLTQQDFYIDGAAIPGLDFTVPDSYAGTLPANEDKTKNIFFWYHPPQTDIGKDDIIIWIQGGQSCSSLLGMLQEVGPWVLPFNSDSPQLNPNSWADFSHLLFVDFPVGVGFSDGPEPPTSATAALDFYTFLVNFLNIFPNLRGKKLWFTGEGNASNLIDYIIFELQNSQYDNLNTFGINYKGFSFYGPKLGNYFYTYELGALEFAIRNQKVAGLNDSLIESLKSEADRVNITNAVPINLVYPPLPYSDFGTYEGDDILVWEKMVDALYEANPCLDLTNVARPCHTDPLNAFGADDPKNWADNWINNTPGFKAYIHADTQDLWEVCVNDRVASNDPSDRPGMIGLAGAVIDSSVRSIIVTSDLDGGAMADGTQVLLQYQTWNGTMGFQNPPTNQLIVDGQAVGLIQQERNLTFVRLPHVGRQVAMDAPAVAIKLQKYLLGQISADDLYK